MPDHRPPAGYRPLKATNRYAALAIARALCTCTRLSFAGVQWREGAEVHQLTWAEIDGLRKAS